MKKLLLALSALAVVSIALVTSCSDDEETKAVKDVLLAGDGTWYYNAFDVTVITPIDTTQKLLYECVKDDYIVFKADGSYTKEYGDSLCTRDETATPGKWSITDNDKTLVLIDDAGLLAGAKVEYTITEIGDKSGKLTIDCSATNALGYVLKFNGSVGVYQK